MSHILHVSTQGFSVGQLGFQAHDNRYSFEYARGWSDSRTAYYLAPAIPLHGARASSASVQRFLENLLPEGRALDIAAMSSQLSKNNIFGLVQLLGKEPVGAFSFLALDATEGEAAKITAAENRDPVRRVISDEELNDRIRQRDAYPFPVWDGKVRLSYRNATAAVGAGDYAHGTRDP